MKGLSIIATSFLLAGACFHQARAQSPVAADSSDWAEIYNPPYKSPTELPPDSALRRELFSILRGKATPQTRFSGSLKVFKNWALFIGRTVDQKGESLKHPPMDNDDALGLWLRTTEGWKLVDFSFGHSDAYFVMFPQQYGVPPELVGLRSDAQNAEDADHSPEVESPSQDKK
jgi:hypothetical protein